MSKNVIHLQHVKSSVVESGKPKLPTASVLVEGEIAVNYADGYETLSIKSSSGNIKTFSSDEYYTEQKLGSGFTGDNSAKTVTDVIEENELVIASSLNDLNARKLDISAYTPTDLSNYYTKSETSGATELSTAFGVKVNSATYTAHTANTSAHFSGNEKENLDSLSTNIATISGISSSNVTSWDNAATNSHSHSNKTYLDGITGNVGTMAYENSNSYSSATQVNTALSNKLDLSVFSTFSASTNESIEDLSGQSETIAAALVYLEENKLDSSAYTPTDLSNYYTKGQTSGATELEVAFSGKQDTLVSGTNIKTINNESVLGSGNISIDISGKEDVTTIVAPVNSTDATLPITSLTCEVGKYYRIDVAVETLAVTLPAMTDLTTVRTVVIYLTAGTTPAVTISSADSKDVYYQDGFEIGAGKTYEVNALFNGNTWIVASVEIVVPVEEEEGGGE